MGLHHGNRLTGDLPVLDVDTNFASNSLLINGEGFNTQNNTFVSTPVGVGTYTGYFNGTGDYLTVPDNAAFDLAAGDWTVETWFNLSALPASSGASSFVSQWKSSATTSLGWFFYLFNNAGTYQLYFSYSTTGSNQTNLSVNLSSAPSVGTWNHVAFVRSGTNFLVFLNGAQVGSTQTLNATIFNSTASVWIGAQEGGSGAAYFFNGYLSNLRIVKGTALYTSSFTVPTSLLSNVTNTVLLTCQDSTFKDNSSNNFTITAVGNAAIQVASVYTITRNGNATQGSFSPYGNNWSTYFDSNSTYLSFPSNTASNLGSSNFTFECWYYPMHTTGDANLFWWNGDSSGSNGWAGLRLQFNTYNGRTVHLLCSESASTWNINSLTGVVYSPNTWYHVAVVRNGATVTAYLNGTSIASGNLSSAGASLYTGTVNLINNMVYPANTRTAGGRANVSNVRMLKGTALYTSNFTPPSTPLTAITNTAVLTCQSNRFVDNSSNNFTITPSGDVRVIKETPFPVAPYNISTIGGSGYFDGTGDYLNIASNAAFALSTGDFTIECWVYINASATQYAPFFTSRTLGNGNISTAVWFGLNNIGGFHISDGSASRDPGTAAPIRQWFHLAWTRRSGVNNVWLNGVSIGSFTSSTNFSSTDCYIGGITTYQLNGYISDMRIVKGTAVYTTSFTPPTIPLQAIPNTVLMMNFTNAGVVDLTGENVIETVGNAQTSTVQKKYGSKSLYFDGTGDYLIIPAGLNTTFGSGDFTIEFWVYEASTQTANLYDQRSTGTQVTPVIYLNSNAITYYVNGSQRITGASLPTGQWNHIALSRSGTNTRLFLNGVQTGSTYTDSNVYVSAPVGIGAYPVDGQSPFNGYIDDLRITKGVARYTASFTPPTKALPNGTASTI